MVSMAYYERRKKKHTPNERIDHQQCKIGDQVQVTMMNCEPLIEEGFDLNAQPDIITDSQATLMESTNSVVTESPKKAEKPLADIDGDDLFQLIMSQEEEESRHNITPIPNLSQGIYNDQNVKHSTEQKHADWISAVGTDTLPYAEYCPDAMEIYLQTGSRGRKSNATLMKVRMHLSYLGWKLEVKSASVSVSVFRYTAPDGKIFSNLVEACKYSYEVSNRISWLLSSPYFRKQSVVRTSDMLGCSNLEESLSQNLGRPSDEVDDRISLGISKNEKAQDDGDICHCKLPPFDISEGQARVVAVDSSLHDQTKNSKPPHTESPAPTVDHVSDAEAMCAEPQNLNIPALDTPGFDVETVCTVGLDSNKGTETQNLDIHVIESASVPEVETDGAISVDYFQSEQSKDSSSHMQSLPVKHVRNRDAIEPEYNPQAVIDWNEIGSDKKKVKLAKQNGSSRSMSLKAKQHLLFVGWNLWHIVKMKYRHELRYTSPMGKTFITLVSACKACIEQGMLYQKPNVICKGDDDKRVHDLRSVEMETDQARPKKRARHILNNFEVHAGNASHQPAAHMLEDERPLLEREKQFIELFKPKCSLEKPQVRIKKNQPCEMNDYICSVCHYGGNLVLCDQCPSSFHLHCLGLNDLPKGQWSCPSCRCGICNRSHFNGDVEQVTENTVLYCDQCEREYHVGCVQQKRLKEIDSLPQGTWFCSQKCEQIYVNLRRLLGKPIATGEDKLTWTLLKSSKVEYIDAFNSATTIKHQGKLTVALGLMRECFEPIKEFCTKKDLIEDVLSNKWSELNRLNFRGFYTILLERDDELVSVATIRIHGDKVAEIPLVCTRFQYRRRGMCHMLMDVLEKKLTELGVDMLVLPAVPQILDAWTTKFGFSKMTSSDRLKFLQYTFLNFQDTTICQKILSKTMKTLVPTENLKQLEYDVKFKEDNFMQAPVRGRRRGPPRCPSTLGNLKLLVDNIKFNYENIDLVPEGIIVEITKENEMKSNGKKILTKAPKGKLKQLGDIIQSTNEDLDLNCKEVKFDKLRGDMESMQAPISRRRRGSQRHPVTSENLQQFGHECDDDKIDMVLEESKVKVMKESELLEQIPVHVKRRRCGPPRRPRLQYFEPTPRLARRSARASITRHHL